MQYSHLRFWVVSKAGNETICLGVLFNVSAHAWVNLVVVSDLKGQSHPIYSVAKYEDRKRRCSSIDTICNHLEKRACMSKVNLRTVVYSIRIDAPNAIT